jgi:hypothetical protein
MTCSTIKFSTTAKGRRAYYWSRLALRWLPLKVAEAEAAVAEGRVLEVRGFTAEVRDTDDGLVLGNI